MVAFVVAVVSMLSLIRASPVMVKAFTHNGRVCAFSRRSTQLLRRFATDPVANMDSPASRETLEPMANLYQEWTIDQDRLLWDNRKEPASSLAALLGRGLRGVESRLSKLKDVNSSSYQRLFAADNGCTDMIEDDMDASTKPKLIPASEVLRRIQWDVSLTAKDFSILHYDRIEDKVVESPFDAPNGSIVGPEKDFVKALPEHRIVGVKYRERVVWDREKRIDRIFSNEGIERVMETYDEWKLTRDQAEAWNKQRQAEVSERIQRILGSDRFARLREISSTLLSRTNDETASKKEVENYVKVGLELFQQARDDPSISLDPTSIAMTDYLGLDALSELVALLPDSELRPMVLAELSLAMKRAAGKQVNVSDIKRELPVLRDEDLTETFIRGSGPGGQKINKTSNRVLLVHEPTQLRVECQDTRALQQNRKIARKRLQLKLDDYLNGSDSKSSLAAKKASSKKSKAKARSRARQRQKKAAGESDEEEL
jgi:uncharacterized protein (UPF0248 family)